MTEYGGAYLLNLQMHTTLRSGVMQSNVGFEPQKPLLSISITILEESRITKKRVENL